MKKLITVTFFAVILGLPNLISAAQVYTYTGNYLTPQTESTPQGRVTATVTLDTPVPSNYTGFVFLGLYGLGSQYNISLSAYGLNLTSGNPQGYLLFENGSISSWKLSLGSWVWGPVVGGYSSHYSTSISTQGENTDYIIGDYFIYASSPRDSASEFYCVGTEPEGYFAETAIYSGSNTYSPGTWSVSSTVPIPAAFWLLGSGLLGLVGFRKKLKR